MSPSLNRPRGFLVGETVTIEIQVSDPRSRRPVDPNSVTIVSLQRDGQPVVVEGPDFDRRRVGDYVYNLATDDLSAGTYDLVVRLDGGPDRVRLVTDRFRLDTP